MRSSRSCARARAGHDVAQPAQQAAGRGDMPGAVRRLPGRRAARRCPTTSLIRRPGPPPSAVAGDGRPRARAAIAPAPGRPARRGSRRSLCSRVTMPTLCPAISEPRLDIAVDDRAAQRAGPEMLDLELRVLLRQLAAVEALDDLALHRRGSARVAGIGERAHRDHRKARIELHRRHRVARRGADEGPLEMRMRDRFVGADKARAELHARPRPSRDRRGSPRRGRCRRRRTPAPRVRCGRISCASTAVETGPIWPPASLPSMTIASAPHAHQLLGQHQRRREAQRRARRRRLMRAIAAPGGMPPASTTWPTRCASADIDQLQELRVHGDEIDAERAVGQRARSRRSRRRADRATSTPRGDHAEAAGIGDRGDEVALRHPGHRAAHDRELGAEEGAAARPQPVEHGARLVAGRRDGAIARRSDRWR